MNNLIIPTEVNNDIESIVSGVPARVHHIGIFGSSLVKGIEYARDIDILIVYSESDFDTIKSSIRSMDLSKNKTVTYMNYGIRRDDDEYPEQYYDLIFMPKYRPNRSFMTRHDGKIFYLDDSFESWRNPVFESFNIAG